MEDEATGTPDRHAILAVEAQRRAAFRRVLIGLLILNVLPFVATVGQSDFNPIAVAIAYGTIVVIYGGALILYRRDKLQASAHLLTGGLFLVTLGCVLFMGGVSTLVSTSFLTVTLVAALTAGANATIIYAALSVIACVGVYWLEYSGLLPAALHETSKLDQLAALLTALVVAAFLLQRGIRQFEYALLSSKESERSHLIALKALEHTQEELLMKTQRENALRDLSEHLLSRSELSEIAALIRDVIERSFPNTRALCVGYDRIRGELAPLEPLSSLGRIWLDERSAATLSRFALGDEPTATIKARDEEGSPLQLLIHSLPSSSGGAPHGLMMIELPRERDASFEETLQDFTITVARILRSALDRLQAERGLRESQRIEALGRLSGGIAHDFNNLLTVILGAGEVLKRSVDGSAAPLVQEIIETGKKASELTRQLLAFASREGVESSPIDVDEVTIELSRILKRLLGNEIELELALESGGRELLADRAGIEQILLNLTVNARDAMPRGGKVTIATSIEHSENLARDEITEYLVLSVSDEGVGMSEDVRARLFEPFFTTKDVDQGTGLGLPTVYGIVNGLGGHIEIESAVGKGSSFRCHFPLGVKKLRRSDHTLIERRGTREESGISPRGSGSETA